MYNLFFMKRLILSLSLLLFCAWSCSTSKNAATDEDIKALKDFYLRIIVLKRKKTIVISFGLMLKVILKAFKYISHYSLIWIVIYA